VNKGKRGPILRQRSGERAARVLTALHAVTEQVEHAWEDVELVDRCLDALAALEAIRVVDSPLVPEP
jgi:hypothetical protein